MITVAQFTAKLDSKIKNLQSDRILRLAVFAVNERRVQRIFEKGQNSSGGKIGNYNSTKPIYVAPEDAPRAVNKKGKTGKAIKSGYYPSYKDFRRAMGRESGFVNLRLNNELQNDLTNAALGKTSNALAAPNPIKVSNTEYKVTLKKDINQKKVKGLTAKYGKFLEHTKQEIELFHKVIREETNLLMAK